MDLDSVHYEGDFPYRLYRDQYGNPHRVYGKIFICRFCGKHFFSNEKSCKGYCSRSCAQTGKRSKNWKGGAIRVDNSYIRIYRPEHPYANSLGYVLKHRLVMEQHLGRYLNPEESVHHKDGNPTNNSVENLQLFSSESEHQKCERSPER